MILVVILIVILAVVVFREDLDCLDVMAAVNHFAVILLVVATVVVYLMGLLVFHLAVVVFHVDLPVIHPVLILADPESAFGAVVLDGHL